MKNIVFTVLTLLFVTFSLSAQKHDPMGYFSKDDAKKVKKFLKEKKYFEMNYECNESWHTTVIRTAKKVWIEKSKLHDGMYEVWVRFEDQHYDDNDRRIQVNWVKVETEDGSNEYDFISNLLGFEGENCKGTD